VYCGRYSKLIPLSFLLGFYVSLVVTRWWDQFKNLAWPDTLAMNLAAYLPGEGRAREVRENVVRWACLCNILALRMVSDVVRRRFPSYQSLLENRLLTHKEMEKLQKLHDKTEGKHSIVWYPMQWAQAALRDVYKEGLIMSDLHHWELTKECDKIASLNGTIVCYGWINIPLVYTQVVTLAVYTYFLASIFGAQHLTPTHYISVFLKYRVEVASSVPNSFNLVGYDSSMVDTYIPVFNVLEFVFYMGWLQVAEVLLNPFGEDDDDFDVNYLIDRNIQLGLFMVQGDDVELEHNPLEDTSKSNDLSGSNVIKLKTVNKASNICDPLLISNNLIPGPKIEPKEDQSCLMSTCVVVLAPPHPIIGGWT